MDYLLQVINLSVFLLRKLSDLCPDVVDLRSEEGDLTILE